MQILTYRDYVPKVVGPDLMKEYLLSLDIPYTYDVQVDPTIFNAFSTAAFRFGHSMVNTNNSYGYQTVSSKFEIVCTPPRIL